MAREDIKVPVFGKSTESEVDRLLAENALLKKALEDQTESQRANARSVSLLGQSMDEVFSKEAEGTMYWFYRIDLPPSGGSGIKLNGVDYYHGETYEFDTSMLQTVKDIVFRTWAHEQSIKGNDENFYRQHKALRLSGKRGH